MNEETVMFGCGGLLVLVVVGLMGVSFFSKWEVSEDNVSGIVYNTTNNALISGNTNFSIRAGENTPTTEENKSSYCLPPNSQYKDLVNRAAGDKRIKVQVTTKKGFWWKAPWTCVDNVTVTEVK
jgi:hypothetical protein